MTTAHKLHIAAYSLLVIVLIAITSFWTKDMIAKARADAINEAAQSQIKDNDKKFEQFKSDILGLMKETKTPAQAVAALPRVVEVPKPIYIAAPETKLTPGDGIIPQESIKPLFDTLAQCKIDEKGYSTCQEDKAQMQKQIDALKVQAKGGTRWQKIVKAAKVIGCAAGGAALGSMSKQRGGAPVGAALGAGACSIF